MGDTGYTQKGLAEFDNLVRAVNRETSLSFVIHIGDFEIDGGAWTRKPDGPMPCTDESYNRNLEVFNSVEVPFIYTPGDNDWTDCSKLPAGRFGSVERLAVIRSKFFPKGTSLGRNPMVVESQSANPVHSRFNENLRWTINKVEFATVHIVGSNDNKTGEAAMDAEHAERQAANIDWLKQTFDRARRHDAKGIVIMAHANLGFENYWPAYARSNYFSPLVAATGSPPPRISAHKAYVDTLVDLMETFERPVAFLHGDTHLHLIDKPLYSAKSGLLLTNFTRVQTFGSPNTHWVRAIVNPDDPMLFTFRAEIVAGN